MKRLVHALVAVAALLSGCAASYIPPGAKADLQSFAPPDIQDGFAAKPTSPFPAGIAAVRVQSSGYSSHYVRNHGGAYGAGRYTVITAREVEQDVHLDALNKLPGVTGVISINRMLLPEQLNSDRDLRVAASRLQADLLFVYTFDTVFRDSDAAKPLSVITLGLSPTRRISVTTTASALLIDTRTGYVYSAYEVVAKRDALATSWGSSDTADDTRRQAEGDAFAKLANEVESSWPRMLARHEKKI